MAVRKLAFSFFKTHKVRTALTATAIALSVSLVVAVTSGYRSLEAAVMGYLTEYLGSTDVQLRGAADTGAIPQSLLAELGADADAQRVVGRLEADTKLLNSAGEPIAGRAELLGVQLPDDVDVSVLRMQPGTSGGWFGGDAGNVAVIDQEAAKLLNVNVGGTITLPGVERKLVLRVVGIVHKPGILAEQMQTIYVPLRTLQEFTGLRGKVNRVNIALRRGADTEAFSARWTPRVRKNHPQVKLRLARESRREMNRNLQGVELMSYMGGTVSMLAATFIVFSTLSMGVTERSRVLAMLRAVGAHKRQIGAMVVFEAMVLGAAGVAVGVPLGVLWVKLLGWWFPEYFAAGVHVSTGGLVMGIGGTMASAAVASFLPAWNAMRVSPLEGLSPLGRMSSYRGLVVCALVALPLLCVDPALLMVRAVPRNVAFYGHFVAGLPCLMLGFFLLSPAFVWIVERLLGTAAARLMGVSPALLRQQLSSAAWRAAGTASALMVGLAILVVIQTQGNTVLNGWRLPDKFPDMFIAPTSSLMGGGLDDQQMEKLRALPGIRRDRAGRAEILPIAIGAAGTGVFGTPGLAFLPNATMFLGIDPDMSMGMMELEFRLADGSVASPPEQKRLRQQAAEMLNRGRHVIVTEEFRVLKGLGVGDAIELDTPRSGKVRYTVAGVVWSPGIDVMVSMFDMHRMFEERSVSSVFGSLEDARRDFGVERVTLLGINLESSEVSRAELQKRIKRTLGLMGLSAGDVREIKDKIVAGFRRLLNLISTVALAAIALASLGVTNTIMASIRTRRWQLGILRSVGVTRGVLLRTILAEALLLGLVGVGLGLAAGLEMSLNANALTLKIFGYGPPVDVPWGIVGLGALLIMAVALGAALGPAIRAAHQEPLALLQAGRAGA